MVALENDLEWAKRARRHLYVNERKGRWYEGDGSRRLLARAAPRSTSGPVLLFVRARRRRRAGVRSAIPQQSDYVATWGAAPPRGACGYRQPSRDADGASLARPARSPAPEVPPAGRRCTRRLAPWHWWAVSRAEFRNRAFFQSAEAGGRASLSAPACDLNVIDDVGMNNGDDRRPMPAVPRSVEGGWITEHLKIEIRDTNGPGGISAALRCAATQPLARALRAWSGRATPRKFSISCGSSQRGPRNHTAGRFIFRGAIWHTSILASLRSQFEEIFVGHQYAFTPERPDPVIVDCGGNIGLSAIWFKLRYPRCELTVYEADVDLAGLVRDNLTRAGFDDVDVRPEAVWIAAETVGFRKTGYDSGRVAVDGSTAVPAIDLADCLPDRVDLLKLDIEGAEFPVLDRLCQTGAIGRVRQLICEFHVWRDRTDSLLRTLGRLRASGMQVSMSAAAVPWLGPASEEAPFEAIQRNHVLMEVFAWQSNGFRP